MRKIYNSRSWKQLRLLKLAVTPLCEYGGPDCTREATEVDHVLAIRKGGAPFDMANLASTCRRCHTDKTNREDGGNRRPRRHGTDPKTGAPLDPHHWWNSGGKNCSELRPNTACPSEK